MANLTPEQQQQLAEAQRRFNEEALRSDAIIESLENRLGDAFKELVKNAQKTRDLNTELGQGVNITGKLNKEILESGKRVEELEFQRVKNLTKITKARGAELDALLESNRQIDAQLKSENLIRAQLSLLEEYVKNEKAITEENKKQNSLAEVLKKKFADQLKSIKEIFTLGSIVDMLFKGSENIANFRKELGISYSNAYALNVQLGHVGSNVFDAYINGEKLKKAFTDLSKEMGFVVDYGTESLVTMTNLTGRLGMSNKEAAQLTTLSRMQSTNTEAVLDNVGKTVSTMNKQGKTAILLKDVMKDIGSVSKAIAVSLGSNPVKIAQAVVAAKQLGTTLEQMESTADALLNFETSIEDELKAELLTGKQMNLERARAAALANDMKTLSEEIGKNEEVISAFASGNRLAQEATAKALGMNREQLAAMVYQQEAMKIGAEGVRAKYGEQAYEQLKAQNAQEKFNNSIEKLKTALSSVVQIFSPIIDLLATVSEFVASIVSQWYIFYPLVGLVALGYLPKMVSSFKNIGKSLTDIGSNFTKLFSKGGRTSLFGTTAEDADKTSKALEEADKKSVKAVSIGKKISDFGKGIGDFIKSIGTGIGKAIQGILTGIGAGFKSLGTAISNPKVILGLTVATLAIMGIGKALQFAAPAIKAIGEAIGTVVTSIATGISTIISSLGDMIAKLGEAGPALLLLGPALFGIAGGLAAMGLSGILALPAILALTALGAVAPSLVTMGIGGGEEEKESINTGIDLTPMINAINEVKAAVDRLYNKDTSINMDGKKVGTTLTQGSYKVA